MSIMVQRLNVQHVINESEFPKYQALGFNQIDEKGNVIVASFEGRTSYTIAEYDELKTKYDALLAEYDELKADKDTKKSK